MIDLTQKLTRINHFLVELNTASLILLVTCGNGQVDITWSLKIKCSTCYLKVQMSVYAAYIMPLE